MIAFRWRTADGNIRESLDKSRRRRERGLWRFIGRHLPGLSVMLMVAAAIAIVLWPYVVITVPSGQVGVLWKRFNGFDLYCWCFVGRGTVLDPRELREEGLHIIWPWDKLFLYDLRLQSATQTYNAISKDGVNVTAQISVRYQLLHNSIGVLHKFIGPGYLAIGRRSRNRQPGASGHFPVHGPRGLYVARGDSEENPRQRAKEPGRQSQQIGPARGHGAAGPEALQRLPAELDPDSRYARAQHRIAARHRCRHQSPDRAILRIQEYKFRVEREAEESKRKQIEADGIAAFQRTVSQGISDSYLRWRGIEATLELAQSPNAKIVIIGSGKDGLPIILGNVDTPAGPRQRRSPAGKRRAPPPAAPPGPSESVARRGANRRRSDRAGKVGAIAGTPLASEPRRRAHRAPSE